MNLLELKAKLSENQVRIQLKPNNSITITMSNRLSSQDIQNAVSEHKEAIISEIKDVTDCDGSVTSQTSLVDGCDVCDAYYLICIINKKNIYNNFYIYQYSFTHASQPQKYDGGFILAPEVMDELQKGLHLEILDVSYKIEYITEIHKLFAIESFIKENQIHEVVFHVIWHDDGAIKGNTFLIMVFANPRLFLINSSSITWDKYDFNDSIGTILLNQNIVKIFYDAKNALMFFRRYLLDKDIPFNNIFDTYLAEKILIAGAKEDDITLIAIIDKYVKFKISDHKIDSLDITKKALFGLIKSAIALMMVFKRQKRLLKKQGLSETADLEFTIISVITDIQRAGMPIDVKKLSDLLEECSSQKNTLEKQLKNQIKKIPLSTENINLNSNAHIKKVLEKLGYKIKKISNKDLHGIDHPFVKKYLNYKKVSTSQSELNSLHRCVDNLRVHTNISQIGSLTGRIYTKEPNLQGVSKKFRKLFIAPPGYKIISADYSQQELRILAAISRDKALLQLFKKDVDVFEAIAAKMFSVKKVKKQQRAIAKEVIYGVCYGMFPETLAMKLKIDIQKADSFIDSFFARFPGVKNKLSSLSDIAAKNGYSETIIGRKIYYDGKDIFSFRRSAKNHTIQSIGADILKKALYYLGEKIRPFDARIINLVHDEIIIECKISEVDHLTRVVENCMIKGAKQYLKKVPIKVSIRVDSVWKQ